ncbi:MAG: hypothetical protein ACI82A_000955 [Candidatus Azotimanducaceae bacterium]|jgi:hypothetical protein
MTSDCNEYRDLLPELVDGQLSALQKQRADQHLNQCDDCSETLSQLWQMQAAASRWEDQPTPHWNRRRTFFPEVSWLPNLQWVSSIASVIVLVLVVTQASVSTADGLSIQFGERSSVTEEALAQVLTELELRQTENFNQRVSNLSNQQLASNQLLLRTVMEMSREERKEELSTLLTAWDYAQVQRSQQTKESISLLLVSQLEDKRNINQINRLLRQASVEGNNL